MGTADPVMQVTRAPVSDGHRQCSLGTLAQLQTCALGCLRDLGRNFWRAEAPDTELPRRVLPGKTSSTLHADLFAFLLSKPWDGTVALPTTFPSPLGTLD